MAQCNSGGFIDDLNGTNKVIATACDYDEYSYGMGEYSYNEFVYHWTSAVAGENPDGDPVDADTNNDGFVSMQEAFDYAELNDSASETPQYDSNKYTLGENLTILGKEICVSTDFFHDFNLTWDADIIDCNIDVDNVTISNNVDVVFDAENIVIIQKDFTISSGSTLIIQ